MKLGWVKKKFAFYLKDVSYDQKKKYFLKKKEKRCPLSQVSEC